ncbi:MAG: HEAT repeat domain-containing protein [Phycisphaerae bacterium]|nr:HEAT repeat domain-containing protein [Phycisphaerae bacterium]
MTKRPARFISSILAVLVVLCSLALAQSSNTKDKETQKLWDELMHYALLGKFDLAKGYGQKLIESKPDPVTVLNLAEDARYTNTYTDLTLMQQDTPLTDIAKGISALVEEGRFIVRTDYERIANEIKRLSGTTRGRMLATNRLIDSGEWAVPQLLEAVRDPDRSEEIFVIRDVLPKLGKNAVNPLVVALQQSKDENVQRVALYALGKIGYEGAVPFVKQVVENNPKDSALQKEALQALRQIESGNMGMNPNAPASLLFERLAEQYYNNTDSLRVAQNTSTANVWFWRHKGGLYKEMVERDSFDELMTMRCCEMSIDIDSSRTSAISLWLSAFFRLEANGHPQPEYFGQAHADASTYALTTGPEYLHRVLKRALDNNNRKVALAAIKSLRRNAGQASLLFDLDNTKPLMESMKFADREVRFCAALAIGGISPKQDFENSQIVSAILTEALSQKGQQFALVADDNDQSRNKTAGDLKTAGYAEVSASGDFSRAVKQATELPSFDLIVLNFNVKTPDVKTILEMANDDYRLKYCPTIIIVNDNDKISAELAAKPYPFVRVADEGVGVDQIKEIAAEILTTNKAQTFSADMADDYAVKAAKVIQMLAVTGNTVLKLDVAEAALVSALYSTREAIQLAAIETLARLDSEKSQNALAAMALDADLDMAKRLLVLENLSLSAKQFGNLLSTENIDAVYAIVMDKAQDAQLRNLAAEAYGSLDLPGSRISKFVLEQAAQRATVE